MAVEPDPDALLDEAWEDETLAEVLEAPVDAPAGVSEGDAKLLEEAFDTETVQDPGEDEFVRGALLLTQLAEAGAEQELLAHPVAHSRSGGRCRGRRRSPARPNQRSAWGPSSSWPGASHPRGLRDAPSDVRAHLQRPTALRAVERVRWIQALCAAGLRSRVLVDLLPCVHTGVTTPDVLETLRTERARIEAQARELLATLDRLDAAIEVATGPGDDRASEAS